ncbi:tol-pal system-associated acyl-CoA thioesterase [Paucibacter sp. APW11]|uniref:Tol-pal system-associated acyl-CoA thioesterase n=1 Tax=Roseateles aquae TaxID=3077235 RepID=A0ABU3P835_9BURK|nr:tol-pal system-associated acyl-CoA thioesterase [Paucibacter sp. APW11]MDT8998731.1 tol-pal system-associated acyl-CoA thioesterase [Paucibacter sp. APW11]
MNDVALPFEHPLRVYWEDTDAGGVVFYANYLKFFERARTEWLRQRGFAQEALRQQERLMFIVSQTSVRYLSPARLDDWLSISVEVHEAGRVSMTLFQQARCGERLLAEGEIRIGCVNADSFKPSRIPAAMLEGLQLRGSRPADGPTPSPSAASMLQPAAPTA